MRTSRNRNLLTSVFVVGSVITGLIVGTAASSPIKPENGTSYGLTNFEIVYPYDDPRTDVPPNPEISMVSYDLVWEGDAYPGEVPCYIEVRDSEGEVIGVLDFTQSSGVSGVRGPGLQVPVSGVPESAEGWCGSPGETRGSGYGFSRPLMIEPRPEIPGRAEGVHERRVSVTFDVRRGGETPPGLRTCDFEIVYADGSREVLAPLNISMADAHERMSFDLKSDRPDQVEDVNVTCRPFQ